MLAKNTAEKQEVQTNETPASYTKSQILASIRYVSRRDILSVILKDNEKYSFDQVNKLLNEFLKGKVK